jgi:hypothetical protein
MEKEKLPSEHLEQVRLVSWMRKTYPQHRIFAVANGGLRTASTAMNLTAEGVTRGIPDIQIPSLKLFIEMKRQKGGVVSPEQKDWIEYLNSIGYNAVICKGFEAAKLEVLKAVEVDNLTIYK